MDRFSSKFFGDPLKPQRTSIDDITSSMAVGRLESGQPLPKGAIRASPHEIYSMQVEIINNWQPRSEIWPLTYGIGILGGICGLSGGYINRYLRKLMQLRHQGRLSTFLPTILIPTAVTMATHYTVVTRKILLTPHSVCPVCMEMRSGLLAFFTGVVQPTLIALLSCSMVARLTHSYALPEVTDTMKLLATYRKMLKPIRGTLWAMVLANVSWALFLTQQEVTAASKVKDVLIRKHLTSNSQQAETEEKID